MTKTHTFIAFIVGAVCIGGGAVAWTSTKEKLPEAPTPTPPVVSEVVVVPTSPTPTVSPVVTPPQPVSATLPTPATTPSATPKERTFTKAQLALHGSASSCYTTIGGNVYDITTYIPLHPGGAAAIEMICGTDGSQLFEGQHGGDPKPERTLASRKIGVMVSE
jgi:hypothetical protein